MAWHNIVDMISGSDGTKRCCWMDMPCNGLIHPLFRYASSLSPTIQTHEPNRAPATSLSSTPTDTLTNQILPRKRVRPRGGPRAQCQRPYPKSAIRDQMSKTCSGGVQKAPLNI